MNSVPLWVTLIGFAAPFVALAGSAIAYVVKLYQDAGAKRRTEFFDLMQLIDLPGSIAKKVAAVYQLRQFPEHSTFIVRFCTTQRQNISGEGIAVQSLAAEMDLTREFFEKQRATLISN